jgi:hypothetical protein
VIEDDECTSENPMETENEQPVSSNSDMDFSDAEASKYASDDMNSEGQGMDYDFDLESTDVDEVTNPPVNSASPGSNANTNDDPIEIDLKSLEDEDDTLYFSLLLFSFAKRGHVSRDCYDNIIKVVNHYIKKTCPGSKPLYSHYKVKQSMLKKYPVKTEEMSVCKGGCVLFDEKIGENQCTNKDCKFFGKSGDNTQKMKYLSLIDQLALLVNNEKTLELMKNPYDYDDDEVIYDIFGATIGEALPKPYSKKKDRLTIYLGLYNDGFQVFKNGKHTTTVFVFVVLNLPPEIRTENKYLLQVCLAPGPKAPTDFFSFVNPIKRELDILQSTGFKCKGSSMIVKGNALFCGGDIPALTKISGTYGHGYEMGCRSCTTKGVRTDNRNLFLPQESIELRERESYSVIDPSAGQKYVSPMSELKAFHGPFFYPQDFMHLFGCNLGPQLAQLMTNDDLYKKATKGENLRLTNVNITKINTVLRASCLLNPTTFSGVCESIDGGYKRAVDWLHFLRFSLSTTLLSFFDKTVQEKLTCFSRICNFACQKQIKKSDVEEMRKSIKEWISWIKELVDADILQPWVYTINLHFLLHLPDLILFLGPMPCYGAFPCERCIQENKPGIKSRSQPAASSGNNMVQLAASH